MLRLVIVAAAAFGLILFVAFVVSRLVRSRTRGLSIRLQVFLALAVIVGAFAFGLGLMVLDRVEARARSIAEQAARDEATSIARVLEGDLSRRGAGLAELAQRLEREPSPAPPLHLQLFGADGRPLYPRAASTQLEEQGAVSVSAPIVVEGELLGTVRVIKPTVVIRALLADFAPAVLVVSLVLGAASALAAAWLGRAMAQPIEALTVFAERVSSGERTTPPPAVFGRELTHLRASLDSMRRQLEGRPFVEAFAADLSHELKNPVAAIRASAELLDEGALEDPEAARRFVQRILESTRRIERLLGELLGLARIEARGVEHAEPVDLGGLARQVLASQGEPAVTLSAEGDLRVRGDAAWLSRALGNLVDNALVHGSPGEVRLELRRQRDWVELRVSNPGQVSPHVRRQIFKRFVTTRASEGGSGLGLSITRAVVEAHGGSVELTSAGPPRVELTARLPAARLLLPDEGRITA